MEMESTLPGQGSSNTPSVGRPLHEEEEDLSVVPPAEHQQVTRLKGCCQKDPGDFWKPIEEMMGCECGNILLLLSMSEVLFSITPQSLFQVLHNRRLPGDTVCTGDRPATIPGPGIGPMTAPPSTANTAIVHQILNRLFTATLGCKLDLVKIALEARNTEYDPSRFSGVVMRIRNPRSTALIFASGKMICFGPTNATNSRLAARKFARIMQKLGFPAKFLDFKIRNYLSGYSHVQFQIRLDCLAQKYSECVKYKPELFPGLLYRMVKPRVKLIIFPSGEVLFAGAQEEISEAFQILYPILTTFKK